MDADNQMVYAIRQDIVAFRKEGVDADYSTLQRSGWTTTKSPSARKVWMLITVILSRLRIRQVAFRKEGVDADYCKLSSLQRNIVAFRKEGVDADL